MKSMAVVPKLMAALLVVLSQLVQMVHANDDKQYIQKFCNERPTGLYCNPRDEFSKIECPSGDTYTCPKKPNEHCQERGILKQYGYKGGVARCVPRLDEQKVEEFCKERGKGVFCWYDDLQNIRVQCPSGIVYKCRDNAKPGDDGPVCMQKTENYAVCFKDSDGGGSGSTTCVPGSTVTVTETEWSTKFSTKTITKTTTLSPQPFVTETTWIGVSTVYNKTTRTQIIVDIDTIILTSFHSELITVTPTVITVGSTQCPSPTPDDGDSDSSGSSVSSGVEGTVYSTYSDDWSYSATYLSDWVSVTTTYDSIPETSSDFALPSKTVTSSTSCTDSTTSSVFPTDNPEDNGDLDAAGSASLILTDSNVDPTPYEPVPCSINSLPKLVPPPNSKFTYGYTQERVVEFDVTRYCRALGGRMAFISDVMEHWYIGRQLCQPVWYKRWAGNDYDDWTVNGTATQTLSGPEEEKEFGCIALYPGGATATPPNQCHELLYGLCKFERTESSTSSTSTASNTLSVA